MMPDVNRPTVGALMDDERRREQLARIDHRLGRERSSRLRRLFRRIRRGGGAA